MTAGLSGRSCKAGRGLWGGGLGRWSCLCLRRIVSEKDAGYVQRSIRQMLCYEGLPRAEEGQCGAGAGT